MTPRIAKADLIESLFKGRPRKITICSPWISTDGVSLLNSCLEVLPAGSVEIFRVWFRMSLEDHLRARTDYAGLLRLLNEFRRQQPKARLELATASNLHAKVYVADSKFVLGSANLTGGGFCGGNLEMVVTGSKSETARVNQALRELEELLEPSSFGEFAQFCKQLENVPVQQFQAEYASLLNRYKPAVAPHYQFRFR